MKRTSLIIGIILITVVLIGAAFVAGQMLATPEEAVAGPEGGRGGRVMEIVQDDGGGPVGVRVSFKPAPELPDSPSTAAGIFVKREDDAIFVGTGDIELDVEVNGNTGKRVVTTDHSGPVIETVISRDTLLYKDVTKVEVGSEARETGEQVVQQTVQPVDSLEEVGENTELQVWGERRGDRIVAEVVVYRLMGEQP